MKSGGVLAAFIIVLSVGLLTNMTANDIKGKREVEAKRQDFVEKCVADTPTTDIVKYNHQLDGCTMTAEKQYPFTERMKGVR